jgi:hypothetical protein
MDLTIIKRTDVILTFDTDHMLLVMNTLAAEALSRQCGGSPSVEQYTLRLFSTHVSDTSFLLLYFYRLDMYIFGIDVLWLSYTMEESEGSRLLRHQWMFGL